MNDIALKYRLLDKTARKEVNDFMDFLLSKKRSKRKNINSEYKKNILSVSTWSENDLKVFEENKRLFNNWNIQEW